MVKTVGTLWEKFAAYDAENNVLTGQDVVKAKKVVCHACGWERFPNQTRMKQHLKQCELNATHEEPEGGEALEVQEEAPGRPTKQQVLMTSFVDRKFTLLEQERAELAQVIFTIQRVFDSDIPCRLSKL